MGFIAFVGGIAINTIWLNPHSALFFSLLLFFVLFVIPLLSPLTSKAKTVPIYREGEGAKPKAERKRGLGTTSKHLLKSSGIIFGNLLLAFLTVQFSIFLHGLDQLTQYRSIDQTSQKWCIDIEHNLQNQTKKLTQCTLSSLNQAKTPPPREPLNDFVQVIDTQKRHTYLVQDTDDLVWRLSSNQIYHLGDQLFLSASTKKLDQSKIFGNFPDNFPQSYFNILKSFQEIFNNPLEKSSEILPTYQFNYDKRLFMKKIDGTAYEKASFLVDPDLPRETQTMMGFIPPVVQLSFIDNLRAKLQFYVEKIYGQNKYAGLLLGLMIGDKSLIPSEDYNTFIESGLVHIIAVSGGNIALVVILLSFLFRFIPFYIRNGLIIALIIVYAMLCGGDSSVIRATIMACLTLFALFWGREISIWRLMKYALILILVINPFSLIYDVGLSLSFSAIIGIVLTQKWRENKCVIASEAKQSKNKFQNIKSNTFKNYILPTIGASLGTTPVLLFFMRGVNIAGILLNMLIVTIIPLITIYGFATLALSFIIPRGGRIIPEIWLMKAVYRMSEFGSKRGIFIVAKTERAKYIIVLIFIVASFYFYRELKNKKKILR